jgi:hypothetical protein
VAATHIRIKIGAALDQSVDAAFASLRTKAQRAGQQVARELSRGMSSGAGGGGAVRSPIERQAREAAKAHAAAMRMIERQERDRASVTEREASRAARTEQRYFDERLRNSRKLAREQERASREGLRAQERAALSSARFQARNMDRFVTRTSHRATRFFMPNAPVMETMRRVGADVLRGAGVETNVQGYVARVVNAQKTLQDVAIQGYFPGSKGAPGKRVSVGELYGEAQSLGQKTGTSTEEVAGGLQQFVDLQGDLEAARASAEKLLILAKGQGAAFEDVMSSAAKANQMFAEMPEYMGDTEKRTAAVYEFMKRITQQGKVGAIPLKEMGKFLGRMTGMTGLTEGDRMTSAIQLTTLAQMAGGGTAAGGAQASTWINQFMLQLMKRQGEFKNITGVQVTGRGGMMRTPFDIIRETLVATAGGGKVKKRGQGAPVEMTQPQMIQEALGGRAQALLGGFMKAQSIFSAATGGRTDQASIDMGIAAVNRELFKFGTSISEAQVSEDLKLAMQTTASKAEVMNQRFEELTSRMLGQAIPALEKLEGPALKVGGALADIFTWAAKNPGDAIVVALAGATVRAAIESTFRASVEAAIYRGTGAIVASSAPASAGLLKVGTQAGFASTGLANVAATAGSVVLALGAVALAADQAGKLWDEIKRLRDEPPPKPGGEADKAGKAVMAKYDAPAVAAARVGWQDPRAEAGLATSKFAGYIEAKRAQADATGRGNPTGEEFEKGILFQRATNPRGFAPGTGVGTRVSDNPDPNGTGLGTRVMEAKLDAIAAQLRTGIRITNPEDMRPKGSGRGVDNTTRDVQ